MSDCFAFNLNRRVIHSKCSREIFPCSAPSCFPLSSSSRLPQIISSLLLMEIPSDPNLLLDEFNPLHVSIIQAFNPVSGGAGENRKKQMYGDQWNQSSVLKPTPKFMELSSLLILGAERFFNILLHLPWVGANAQDLLDLSNDGLLFCFQGVPGNFFSVLQGLRSFQGLWLISPCVCIVCMPACRRSAPAWPLSQPAISTILWCISKPPTAAMAQGQEKQSLNNSAGNT